MESPWRTLGPVDAVFKRNHLRMLLGAVLLAGAVLYPILINTIFKPSGPKPLTETSLINEQAKYEIQLCTEEFASSSDGYKTNHYYLASDGLSWRIVMLSEATAKRCEPIIDYSYGDTDIAPLPLVVEGLSAAIPEQLQEYALEVVQMLIDENADPTTLQNEIGSLMLVEGALDILPHQLRADDRFIAGDRAQLEDVQGIADISAAVAGDQLSRFGIQPRSLSLTWGISPILQAR